MQLTYVQDEATVAPVVAAWIPTLLASAAAEVGVETILVAQKIYVAAEPPAATPASDGAPPRR